MRSLETEVSRLREAYTNEISDANNTIQQQKELIQSVRDENEILKEILSAHGVKYEAEVEQRRAERPHAGFRSSPVDGSTNGSHSIQLTNGTSVHHATPPTTISGMSPRMHAGLEPSEVSPPLSFAPPRQVYGNGGAEQLSALDLSASHIVDRPVPAMVKGVFENEPQLQIDFILKCVNLPPLPFKPRTNSDTDWKVLVASIPISSAEGL